MTVEHVLTELESLGTEQNRKIYRRHAADPELDVYGVSYANMYALRKRIKVDHALALELWPRGTYEARVMALFVADPERCDAALLDRWAHEVTDQGVADAFGKLAVRTRDGVERALAWVTEAGEMVQRCGWNTLGGAMKEGTDGLTDAAARKLLASIEEAIHVAPNRAREGMNYALIALGTYKPNLRDEVLAAAGRIGAVHIDHGETFCKTPDAASSILKAVQHRAKKAASAP